MRRTVAIVINTAEEMAKFDKRLLPDFFDYVLFSRVSPKADQQVLAQMYFTDFRDEKAMAFCAKVMLETQSNPFVVIHLNKFDLHTIDVLFGKLEDRDIVVHKDLSSLAMKTNDIAWRFVTNWLELLHISDKALDVLVSVEREYSGEFEVIS